MSHIGHSGVLRSGVDALRLLKRRRIEKFKPIIIAVGFVNFRQVVVASGFACIWVLVEICAVFK